MNESQPSVHPTDEHPESQPTSRGLDTADSDARVRDQREREEAAKSLPKLTEEEKISNLEQARRLRDRYDPNKAA